MIRITKIELNNYRQYQSIVIPFNKNKEYDLHILRAKNGTGKTTFLNSILWCLYGKELYVTDINKALPIVNNAMVQNSSNDDHLKVSVRITIEDDERILLFERKQIFLVKVSPISGIKSANTSSSILKITEIPTDGSNSTVYEDELTVQSMVKQYFDASIFDYYFFDGENLRNYFAEGKSEKIKSSIFNIAQVTLLKNAANHVRVMADERYRKSSKMDIPTGTDLLDSIQRIEDTIQNRIKENKEIEQKKPILKRIIEEADAELHDYAPVRMNIERRDLLESQLENLVNDYEVFKAQKNEFITKYMTLLPFYPRVKYTLNLIQEKQNKGSLPPNIDKDKIQTLLDEHAKNCPVCNGKLDERAIVHLREIIKQLDVSSATSNFLMEIKGSLEIVVSECKNYPQKRDDILKKEKYFVSEIAEKRNDLDVISKFLSKYSDESGALDVKKLESDRMTAQSEMTDGEVRFALNQKEIQRLEKELAEKIDEKEKLTDKMTKKGILSQQVRVLRKLQSNFELIQNCLMDEIKDDIELQTWERFDSMIWKKNTFGNLKINDSYELSIYNKNGNEMTGSLSATEYMALAYAFTLAIHDASGKNCPLVVDSPLGRVSDDNRFNMANELLKVSKNKQIIMLFTPDEYSADVKRIYNENAATIRDITLSGAEDKVESVGDINAR